MSAINRRNPFPSLVEALRLLPDIRPVCERHRLGEVKHEAMRARNGTADINGVPVTLRELEELFLDGEGGSPRVSPAGAGLLLQLFTRGAFESADYSRCVEGGVELLTGYAQGRVCLIDSRFWRKADRKPSPAPTPRVTRRRREEIAEASLPRPPLSHVTVHRLI